MTEFVAPPFAWFGGKRKALDAVWSFLGDCHSYSDPFGGSCVVPLNAPPSVRRVVVGDVNGHIVNAWRAMAYDPDAVADALDQPVFHLDLRARAGVLRRSAEGLATMLGEDPDFYDARLAGWWIWAIRHSFDRGESLTPHDTRDMIPRSPHGPRPSRADLRAEIRAIHDRVRHWYVLARPWATVVGSATLLGLTQMSGPCGLLLDPPYDGVSRLRHKVYASDGHDVAGDVRRWLTTPDPISGIAPWDHPRLRIVYCGYDGDFADSELPNARKVEWARTGKIFARGQTPGDKATRSETLWASPACVGQERLL